MTTYYLGFADEEFQPSTITKQRVMRGANLPDGWCRRRNCHFQYSNDPETVHTVFHVCPDEQLVKKFPSMQGFSVTHWPTYKVPRIYLNLDNLQQPPVKYKGSKDEYLDYVVQHELGHAIFGIKTHDREDDRHPVTKMCSVMYQQTRGTNSCVPGYKYYLHDE